MNTEVNTNTVAAKLMNPAGYPPEGGVKNNPNFKTFQQVNQDIQDIVNSKSIVAQAAKDMNKRTSAAPAWSTFFDGEMLALPLATNKAERLDQYRRISKYNVCDWCFDEIADDFLHEDVNGDLIHLDLPERLNEFQKDILQNEFKKYMGYFNLYENGYNLVKRFMTEGELAWENIINPKYPDKGIIGVKFLPAEYYETLIDIQTNSPVGIVFDVASFKEDVRQMYLNSFQGSASIFNAVYPTTYRFTFSKDTCIPLLYSQVTYINSGEYSPDFLVSYPLIEKAKQAYYKLALLEDAAVILRVTRAPERLLFNVSTGMLDQNRADDYVRRFANSLHSKKVSSQDGNDIMGVYSPITQLKAYVFGKSSQSDGTTVESVGSSASYDEMGDIEYFLRAFLKMFKVPFSRWKTPENTIEKNDSITYEEYTFSRMIMRYQRRFAEGFKRGFITHLKLRDLWSKKNYELKESDIKVAFTPPVLYDYYEKQKMVEAQFAIYKSYVDNDEMSRSLAMKNVLGWSDEQIEENFKCLMKDKQMVAVADYFADLVSTENPPVDFKSPVRLKNDVEQKENVFTSTKSKHPSTSEGSEDEEGEGGDLGRPDEGPGSEPAEFNFGGDEEIKPEEPTFGLG